MHARKGILAGLDADAVERSRAGAEPAFPDDADDADDTACRFLGELLDTRRVSEQSFAAAQTTLGVDKLVALVAAAGFFSCAGMTLSAFKIETD